MICKALALTSNTLTLKAFGPLAVAVFAASLWGTGPVHAASETGLARLHAMRHEGGRVCFSSHRHYRSGGARPSRAAAVDAAVRAWERFTAFEYGGSWGSFARAAGKNVDCSPAGRGFSCNVDARPCK